MSWFQKKAAPTIPVVPDDVVERKAAIEKSRQALRAAEGRVEGVKQVVESVNGHYTRNHYRDLLYAAYGGKIND